MRSATITTTSGHTWTTEINGTDESICDYFLGQWFDVDGYLGERYEQAISVAVDGAAYVLHNGEIVRAIGYSVLSALGSKDWELSVVASRNSDGTHNSIKLFTGRSWIACLEEYHKRHPRHDTPLYLESACGHGTTYSWIHSLVF